MYEYCETGSEESKTTQQYARSGKKFLAGIAGGPENCFLLVVDAGTPGARGQEEKLQAEIQKAYPWVSVALCNAHQADLALEGMFKLPIYRAYRGSMMKNKLLKGWVKKHDWAQHLYRKLGGKQLLDPDTTRFLYAAIHQTNTLDNKAKFECVFASEEFKQWQEK